MKHLFVVNPVAGGKKGNIEQVKEKLQRFIAGREDSELYETASPMDAAIKVKREAVRGTPLRVYACGGDGTLSECAHGAAGFQNCAVTHYPCGTGNDFIRTFGEENFPLFTDLEALTTGEVRPIDIIDVNGRKCINIFSVGVDARVAADVHKVRRVIDGKGAYVLSLIMNVIKGVVNPMTVTVADQVFEGRQVLVCACNGQYYGGGFHPTGKAQPDDGVMDILVVKGVSRLKFARYVKAYANGEYEKYPDIITALEGLRMKVESDKEFAINVDGEITYSKTATVRLFRGGLNFIYPNGFVEKGAGRTK